MESDHEILDLKGLNLNKLEPSKQNPVGNLSPSEVFVLENQKRYIQLQEEESSTEDITEDLLNLTKKLSLGQMAHTDDFTLEETMNSVELDHFKMDSHYNFKSAMTYKRLLKEGKVKKIEDLNFIEVC